jgi:hypothetical protein
LFSSLHSLGRSLLPFLLFTLRDVFSPWLLFKVFSSETFSNLKHEIGCSFVWFCFFLVFVNMFKNIFEFSMESNME